jgi:hypothetical protein
MRAPWESFAHTFTALALCAPILAFYVVIASEAFGGPSENYLLVSTTSFSQICNAWAKDRR